MDKAAKAYRVYFSKTEEHNEDEPYLVDHSIVIYLLAPDGDFLDFFTQRTTVRDRHVIAIIHPTRLFSVCNCVVFFEVFWSVLRSSSFRASWLWHVVVFRQL